MIKIEEGKELIYENVISFRGVMTQVEMQDRMQKIGKLVQDNQLTLSGKVTTTTFAIDPSSKFDMEILVPVDRALELPVEYKFKKEFKLFNAVYARHVGNPALINSTYEAMNKYVEDKELIRISSGYNVTVNESSNMDDFIIDVYIGVNSNIL
jgi:hypothetical protein